MNEDRHSGPSELKQPLTIDERNALLSLLDCGLIFVGKGSKAQVRFVALVRDGLATAKPDLGRGYLVRPTPLGLARAEFIGMGRR